MENTDDSFDAFLADLCFSLRTLTEMDWQVSVIDGVHFYIITASVGKPSEVDRPLRETVVWTFSPDGKTAAIKLRKPVNFMQLTAKFMAGNLFGGGLTMEMK